MVAVYTDAAPPLVDVNRQILNFIEVYEPRVVQAGCFPTLFLQLTLWHLDPLRASAFVPLPDWIQTRRAFVNVEGRATIASNRLYWQAHTLQIFIKTVGLQVC